MREIENNASSAGPVRGFQADVGGADDAIEGTTGCDEGPGSGAVLMDEFEQATRPSDPPIDKITSNIEDRELTNDIERIEDFEAAVRFESIELVEVITDMGGP